jgi:hypothetical protein
MWILAETIVYFIETNPLSLLVVGVSLLLVLLMVTLAKPDGYHTHLASHRYNRRRVE